MHICRESVLHNKYSSNQNLFIIIIFLQLSTPVNWQENIKKEKKNEEFSNIRINQRLCVGF